MDFLRCILYIAILGILCFPAGRLLAKISFQADKFPFRQAGFEKNGKFYETIKIKNWQNKIPDVSKAFSKIVPRKSLADAPMDSAKIAVMINETCVAELTHVILSFLGLALPFIWRGAGGIVFFLVYVLLGNLPFIFVQRFNRPRLCRLHKALAMKEQRKIKAEDKPQTMTVTNGET